MYSKHLSVLLLIVFQALCEEITFKNVELLCDESSKKLENVAKLSEAGLTCDEINFKGKHLTILYEKSFSNLNTSQLILDNNDMVEIKPTAFENSVIKQISLENNKLQKIKHGIFNGVNVKVINLRYNKIHTVDSDAFDDIPILLNVDLSGNKIKEIDNKWFKNCPQLAAVTLAFNKLTKIPKAAFKNLGEPKGKEVDIFVSENEIDTIDKEAFDGLENIGILSLAFNKIDKLDVEMFNNLKIKKFWISLNEMTCLKPEELEKLFEKVEEADFDQNLWECKCYGEMKKWIEEHNKTAELSTHNKC